MYHVYSRGSNRQAIFQYDSDRLDFLVCLEGVVHRFDLSCLAYCLMPNHYHLVVATSDGLLSPAMRSLNGRYALRFNQRYQRDAHLFKNRFGSVTQETDVQLKWTVRYVIWNPVRSRLCADPTEWPWSSARASAGLEPGSPALDMAALLAYFGDEPETARSRLRLAIA